MIIDESNKNLPKEISQQLTIEILKDYIDSLLKLTPEYKTCRVIVRQDIDNEEFLQLSVVNISIIKCIKGKNKGETVLEIQI